VKKLLPVVDGSPGPSDRTYRVLSAEEQRAIQLRRAITAMEGRWAAFGRHNQECKSRSKTRGPVLIAKTHLPCDSLMLSEDTRLELSKLEKCMEEYQKEALFGHMRDQVMQDNETDEMRVNSSDDYLVNVLLSVEDAFIRRCSAFLQSFNTREDSKVTRMSRMMKLMQEELWEEIKESDEEGRDEGELVARFLSSRCPSGMIFDLLAEQYFRILFEDLVKGVVAKRNGLAIPTLTLVQELKDSRRVEDELTSEYLSWAISVLDHTELAKQCKDWSRDQTIKDFRSMFKNCIQEFVEDPDDISSESTVSLILLKGNKLVNTQPVAIEDLRRMGWYRQKPHSKFWRYQRKLVEVPMAWQKYLGMDAKITGGKFRFDVILKVRMDGEVIVMSTPDGVLNWDDHWNMLCEHLQDLDPYDFSWAVS